jgi:hypothetical protein
MGRWSYIVREHSRNIGESGAKKDLKEWWVNEVLKRNNDLVAVRRISDIVETNGG